MYVSDQVSLDGLCCLSGVVGDGDGDVHIVGLGKACAPQNELLTGLAVSADGLVEVVDVNVGNIVITGGRGS